MTCDLQAAGTIELYFYGELPAGERAAVKAHLNGCAECRAVLEDLSVIRAALASRPGVAAPLGGDWSGFMRRLDAAVAAEQTRPDAPRLAAVTPLRRRLAPYLALAATLAPANRASSVAAVTSPGVAAAAWKTELRSGKGFAAMKRHPLTGGRTLTAGSLVSK